MASVLKFVERTISLLNLERETEIEETKALSGNTKLLELQRRGLCLLKLGIRSRYTGLYGRTMLSFETRKTSVISKPSDLPAHSFTQGDIAGLGWSGGIRNSTELGSGIVTHVTRTFIIVAFDDISDAVSVDDDASFQLIKLANDVTYRRTKSALNDLSKSRDGPSRHLVDVLFGIAELGVKLVLKSFSPESDDQLFNKSLNKSQRTAVQFALSQPDVAIIHGPPGTGKTTTVIEIILQAVKYFGIKVLACAPSNVAVDNMVERLAHSNARIVRLGHPARLLSDIQKYSLDAILSSSDAKAIVQDVRRDIDNTLNEIRLSKDIEKKKRLRQEIKYLKKELKEREEKAIKETLKAADIILVTTSSASSEGPLKHLSENHFGLVIIDEVAQALEASCWIPLLRTERCILAGDHHQLPPTILSQKAAKEGLSVSLMERLIDLHGDRVVHMLTTQYRMNQKIMEWPSEQLYQGRLTAHKSVQNHLLKDLAGVKNTENTSIPVLFIDTAGCDVVELKLEDEVSKGNEGEADIVTAHVAALVEAGIRPDDIAVISPYNLQVELIRRRLLAKYPRLEIKSVDGFQGREKEAVIISFVRSNEKGEVGFLAEERRINVAITRARRHLAVVADSETVGRNVFLGSLLDYMSREGEVRSAMEYQDHVIVGDAEKFSEGSEKLLTQKPKMCDSELSQLTISAPNNCGKIGKKRNKNCKTKAKTHCSETVAKEMYVPENSMDDSSKSSDRNVVLGNTLLNSTQGAITLKSLTREDLEKEIKNFLYHESRQELVFPVTLSSQERFYVHSIAEEFGIFHESHGEGQQRSVVVKKVVKQGKSENSSSTCPHCNKPIPKSNLSLHLLRCERLNQSKLQSSGSSPPTTRSGSSKYPKSYKKKKPRNFCSENPSKDTEEDFDKMVASFTKLDSECAFDRCHQSVITLGEHCVCCEETYCLSHRIPEVHGCGAAAKIRAKKQVAANGGSQSKPKKLSVAQKTNLRRKLDKKVEEMAEKRKPSRREERK